MRRFLAVDPDERMRITLSAYEGVADPPIITAKYLTAREQRRFMVLLDSVKGEDEDADVGALTAALVLAGVELAGEPAAKWPDILRDEEVSELLTKILVGNRLTREQLKNSGSPSRSDSASVVLITAGAAVESNSHAEPAAAI